MAKTLDIAIYVRHSKGCKDEGDEYSRRCNCRKHFRWSIDGKQYRHKAGTRSWTRAEEIKTDLAAQLTDTTPANERVRERTIAVAIEIFLKDKKNQGVTPKVIGKYTRELARLRTFCADEQVYLIGAVNKELLTEFATTWKRTYPAASTRSRVRERLSTFLRFCAEAGWLRMPIRLAPIKVEKIPTMPLTADEYGRLLDATYATFADNPKRGAQARALLRLMRFSGLAIRDALTLERREIIYDKQKDLYRVVTSRQKTGTDVSVPIPKGVAEEVLATVNENPKFLFWSGTGQEESATKNWAKHLARLFKDAKVDNPRHMRSHRLRDTFACELLQRGVPLEEVSKMLGHDSITTTEDAYGAWVKGRQDRLDNLVLATWDGDDKR